MAGNLWQFNRLPLFMFVILYRVYLCFFVLFCQLETMWGASSDLPPKQSRELFPMAS